MVFVPDLAVGVAESGCAEELELARLAPGTRFQQVVEDLGLGGVELGPVDDRHVLHGSRRSPATHAGDPVPWHHEHLLVGSCAEGSVVAAALAESLRWTIRPPLSARVCT